MSSEDYVPPGEPGGEDASPWPPEFTPEDPDPPLYVPPPVEEEGEGVTEDARQHA